MNNDQRPFKCFVCDQIKPEMICRPEGVICPRCEELHQIGEAAMTWVDRKRTPEQEAQYDRDLAALEAVIGPCADVLTKIP